MNLNSHSPSDNPALIRQILEAFPEERIFALYGEMGAGTSIRTCKLTGNSVSGVEINEIDKI